jgi:hypothetical protein
MILVVRQPPYVHIFTYEKETETECPIVQLSRQPPQVHTFTYDNETVSDR